MGCAGRISPEFGRVSPMTAAGGFRVKRHASSFCIAQAAVNRSISDRVSRSCTTEATPGPLFSRHFKRIGAGRDEAEPLGALLADIGDRETLLPGAQR